MRENLRIKYLAAADSFRLLMEKEERYLLWLSVARLLSFVCGTAVSWLVFCISSLAGFIVVLLVLGFFFFLLRLYAEHTSRKEYFGSLVKINCDEAKAVSGVYSHFEPGNKYSDPSHDFSFDVDLFGGDSLFQYLNRTVTGYGRDILAGWLLQPFDLAGSITSRQATVQELSNKKDWMHDFMASGMKTPLEKDQIEGLLKWLGEGSIVKSLRITRVLIGVLPFITITSLILVITGFMHYSIFTFLFLGNLFWITTWLKRTNSIHNVLTKKYLWLSSFNKLLKVIEKEEFLSDGLNAIRMNLAGSRVSAAVAVKKLSSLIQAFDSRMNIMVGFILNGLLLWDLQCILRLEKWKAEYKDLFPGWLEMIGTVDAYISLGNFSYNSPEFAYPQISENGCVFSAAALGHPLIQEGKRVCNDFVLEHKGNLVIVTGANMAGKSTFLRTVAVNLILAMEGAPVCASALEFTPMNLFTSMRTTDSLSNNESYFYAELKRLKTLKAKIENNEQVFLILDEILKGTNSADKSLGSKLFLKKIMELGGTGLIATHDTSLGEMEKDYPQKVLNMCFEIEIEGESIRFDYKLRKGITQKMNAALLMNQMGILG